MRAMSIFAKWIIPCMLLCHHTAIIGQDKKFDLDDANKQFRIKLWDSNQHPASYELTFYAIPNPAAATPFATMDTMARATVPTKVKVSTDGVRILAESDLYVILTSPERSFVLQRSSPNGRWVISWSKERGPNGESAMLQGKEWTDAMPDGWPDWFHYINPQNILRFYQVGLTNANVTGTKKLGDGTRVDFDDAQSKPQGTANNPPPGIVVMAIKGSVIYGNDGMISSIDQTRSITGITTTSKASITYTSPTKFPELFHVSKLSDYKVNKAATPTVFVGGGSDGFRTMDYTNWRESTLPEEKCSPEYWNARKPLLMYLKPSYFIIAGVFAVLVFVAVALVYIYRLQRRAKKVA